MKKMSKGFYLGSLIAAGALGLLFYFFGFIEISNRELEAGIALILVGIVFFLYAGIVVLILWYKAWEIIQDGNARTTPGKAIGFLFIPFFGIYWMFQAIWGYSKDFNSYIERNHLEITRLPEGLFLTVCILGLCGIIPILGTIIAIVNAILGLIMLNAVIDGYNSLVDSKPVVVNGDSPTT